MAVDRAGIEDVNGNRLARERGGEPRPKWKMAGDRDGVQGHVQAGEQTGNARGVGRQERIDRDFEDVEAQLGQRVPVDIEQRARNAVEPRQGGTVTAIRVIANRADVSARPEKERLADTVDIPTARSVRVPVNTELQAFGVKDPLLHRATVPRLLPPVAHELPKNQTGLDGTKMRRKQ